MTLTVVRTVAELRAQISAYRDEGWSVGLVTTMGALHEGHMSLVLAAKASCDRVVATIFVNPTQFGPNEDLAAYPRDEAADIAKLEQGGADLLFVPGVAEMYPAGFATSVSVAGLTDNLCGVFRPTHFGGVATVVTKLLLQSLPDRAFFGEKDYQQLQVIRRLTRDLDIPVEIVGVPTVREEDGLAMSSRNRYLSPENRKIAGNLPKIMRKTVSRLATASPAAPIIADAKDQLLKAGFTKIDYLELCNADSLQPITAATSPSRLFVAAFVGKTRLIDNWPVL